MRAPHNITIRKPGLYQSPGQVMPWLRRSCEERRSEPTRRAQVAPRYPDRILAAAFIALAALAFAAAAQADVFSGTLNVKSVTSGKGCYDSGRNEDIKCKNPAVLSNRDFRCANKNYKFYGIRALNNGQLNVRLTGTPNADTRRDLVLHLGTSEFHFSADSSGSTLYLEQLGAFLVRG